MHILILTKNKVNVVLILFDYILIAHHPKVVKYSKKYIPKFKELFKKKKLHDYTTAFVPQEHLLNSTIILSRILCSKQRIKKIMEKKVANWK